MRKPSIKLAFKNLFWLHNTLKTSKEPSQWIKYFLEMFWIFLIFYCIFPYFSGIFYDFSWNSRFFFLSKSDQVEITSQMIPIGSKRFRIKLDLFEWTYSLTNGLGISYEFSISKTIGLITTIEREASGYNSLYK